jgi:hypothetical protein
MVFTVKPSLMPSSKEYATRASLETYTPNNLSVVSTGLVF